VYRRDVLARHVRTTIARWLEEGALSNPASRALGQAHAAFAGGALARPLVVPARNEAGARPLLTVTVGGSTLGGSGKTRVALACALELASHGANVVLIGHAYRASPGGARVVTPHDSLDDVGDEALACARALARESVRVVVAPSRQAAVDFAARLVPRVDALVLDGPLQLAPARASLSLLALDAAAPWGSGAAPPAGDLRASPEALLAHADEVVHVDATPRFVQLGSPPRTIELASFAASLAKARVGLFTALARPDRLVRALAAAGLEPGEVIRAGDHGPLTPGLVRLLRAADARVDVWLATAKCAVHLEHAGLAERLAILDGSLVLPPSVALALQRLAGGR
jgi:tetraacyldisaccharide 4'-kinase